MITDIPIKDIPMKRIAYFCAYTPIPIIDAAGYIPYRVLPITQAQDQAGHLLHDNMCPHIKRILDRAIANDLPDLYGAIFINSCDAMRRLSDAWQIVRPDDHTCIIDLPVDNSSLSIEYLSYEFDQCSQKISQWTNKEIFDVHLQESIYKMNELTKTLQMIQKRFITQHPKGGSVLMQELYNDISTSSLSNGLTKSNSFLKAIDNIPESSRVPIYLFGNVLPDPESFQLFEDCGATIVNDDLCTGSRLFHPIHCNEQHHIMQCLAQSYLLKPLCARTIHSPDPNHMATQLIQKVQSCQARGVIGHTIKFCDPYLARLPAIRDALKKEKIPFLLLEGDCTLRSIGQQRTRIEAFIEML